MAETKNILKSKKIIILLGVLLIIIIIISGLIYLKQNTYILDKKREITDVLGLTKTKNKEFVGKYISEKEVDNKSVFGSGSNPEDKALSKKKKSELDEVKSYIRTICANYTKITDVLSSSSFKIMKTKITKIKNASEDKDTFLYVTLPEFVSANCITTDDKLRDLIIRYLQSDYTDSLALDKENTLKYKEYINNIKLGDTTNISKTRLRTDSEYFKEVFFKDNLAGLENVFFSEYSFLKDRSDEDYFKYFSILGLEEKNQILEQTIGKLTKFLNDIGIKSLGELRSMILKNYGYGPSLDSLKTKLIGDYKEFDKKTKAKGINLTLELVDVESLGKFYIGEKFKIIKNDSELYSMFNKIGLEHLHYSIISDKYADALNEGWSGKEQFGDSIIGNGLIRLGFLYLRETQKNTGN